MKSECIFNTMEVLDTKPISDLVTEAIIKVCYVSQLPNRNGTVINKAVGKEIAATLPGAPVVGLFDTGTQDFVEHSRKVTIENNNIRIEDLTKPYGFVSFEQPWYQDFLEDGVNRTYLMCKAYLWTKQYPEAAKALNKGQSMQLDDHEIEGYYEGDVFVFTHATLDKLCILGDSYQPCFEGAKIFTTYAKQYNSFAEDVEDILGRRYFVHQGQLMPMEKNTVKYALKLGFDLEQAICRQLVDRGIIDFNIEGVYAANGELFVVIQNNADLSFNKIAIKINEDDTIVVDTAVQEVSMIWGPTGPNKNTSVVPLTENPEATKANQEQADKIAALKAELASLTKESSEFTVKENQYIQQIEDLNNQISEFAKNTADNAGNQISELTNKVNELNEIINGLNAEIDAYKVKEASNLKKAKEEMINSFAELLSEEDLASVRDHVDEYSLEDVENKLAVTYARISKKNTTNASGLQLNVNLDNKNSNDNELPSFLQQAMEYDNAHMI